jgi:hypothetical protein
MSTFLFLAVVEKPFREQPYWDEAKQKLFKIRSSVPKKLNRGGFH